MKKLMIAAASAAIVGGAFAACTPSPTPTCDEAWVYTWTFSGKTTTGYLVKGSSWSSGKCTPGGGSIADCAIRIPSSLKIQGYTYLCCPECGGWTDIAADWEAFYTTKPTKEYIASNTGVKIRFGHVIGKKAKDFELFGNFNAATTDSGERYNLAFAGLGKYDLKNTRISSVSGNFAGLMEVPHYHEYDATIGGCPEAWYWDCTGTIYAGHDMSVAYGSWSMKYNSSASKKYFKDGTMVKLPTIK